MPKRPLPPEVPEIGYVIIQIGLREDGVVAAYDYSGIEPEAVIGYLTAFSDMVRDDLRAGWTAVEFIPDEEDEDEETDDE